MINLSCLDVSQRGVAARRDGMWNVLQHHQRRHQTSLRRHQLSAARHRSSGVTVVCASRKTTSATVDLTATIIRMRKTAIVSISNSQRRATDNVRLQFNYAAHLLLILLKKRKEKNNCKLNIILRNDFYVFPLPIPPPQSDACVFQCLC